MAIKNPVIQAALTAVLNEIAKPDADKTPFLNDISDYCEAATTLNAAGAGLIVNGAGIYIRNQVIAVYGQQVTSATIAQLLANESIVDLGNIRQSLADGIKTALAATKIKKGT